jgi:glycosyltransferase involved in cell wall biosynthesis
MAGAPLKVLIIPEYPAFQPQAMVRAFQYRPFFAQDPDLRAEFITHRNYPVERVLDYIARRSWGLASPLTNALTRLVTRQRERTLVRRAAEFDLVYVIKVRSLSLYQQLAAQTRAVLVKDFGDALWMPSHQGWGWGGLDEMLRLADGVICENNYVQRYAQQHNARTHVVEDAPQVEDFDAVRGQFQRDPNRLVLGWVGTPGNACCLYAIWDVLEKLFVKYPQLTLRVVGARASDCPRWERVRATYHHLYDQRRMIQELLAMDIGLFPHFDVVDAAARGTLKAKIYMAGEVAAVCQRVGENVTLVRDGENALLAAGPVEWAAKLEHLIEHAAERRALAARGLQFVRTEFSREANFQRLKAALLDIARAPRRRAAA